MSLWREYGPEGLQVIGISSEPLRVVEGFIEGQGITFPILSDPGRTVYGKYALPGAQSPYPRDFIIDGEGTVHYADTEYDPGTMITVVESLLREKTVSVTDDLTPLPSSIELESAYPNPFNGEVVIAVHSRGTQKVDLEIFDIRGRRLERLYSGPLTAGKHIFRWAPSESGFASGVYLAVMKGEGRAIIRKMTFLQ